MGTMDVVKEVLETATKFVEVVEEKAKELDGLVETNKNLAEKGKAKVADLAEREKAIKATEHKIKTAEEFEAIQKTNDIKYFSLKKERKELDIRLKAFDEAQERFAKEGGSFKPAKKEEAPEVPAGSPAETKKPKTKPKK